MKEFNKDFLADLNKVISKYTGTDNKDLNDEIYFLMQSAMLENENDLKDYDYILEDISNVLTAYSMGDFSARLKIKHNDEPNIYHFLALAINSIGEEFEGNFIEPLLFQKSLDIHSEKGIIITNYHGVIQHTNLFITNTFNIEKHDVLTSHISEYIINYNNIEPVLYTEKDPQFSTTLYINSISSNFNCKLYSTEYGEQNNSFIWVFSKKECNTLRMNQLSRIEEKIKKVDANTYKIREITKRKFK